MVQRLRTFRPVAEQYLPGEANPDDPPLTVIAFQRASDFRRTVGTAEMAGYMQPSFTESLMVVGPDHGGQGEHESLLHEYVHYLLRTRNDVNIPTWFDEGLASMLSSAEFRPGEVEIGVLPTARLEGAIRESRLRLADVLGAADVWDWRRDRRAGFYAWSWLLVHRLMLGHQIGQHDLRAATVDFLAGNAPTLASAIGTPVPSLQRELERYLERREPRRVHEVAVEKTSPPGYRCLSSTRTVRQLAEAVVQLNPELVARHLTTELEDRADDPELWTLMSLAEEASGRREPALDAARRAVALAPDDISANVRLASTLAMGCILDVSAECRGRWQEAVPLLRRALRRDPARQDAIFTLGLAYLYSGRAGDALNYLRIAHQRQPWAPHVNFYLGESYRIIGDVRAREHLARARQWSPTELWRKMAEAGLERLRSDGG